MLTVRGVLWGSVRSVISLQTNVIAQRCAGAMNVRMISKRAETMWTMWFGMLVKRFVCAAFKYKYT